MLQMASSSDSKKFYEVRQTMLTCWKSIAVTSLITKFNVILVYACFMPKQSLFDCFSIHPVAHLVMLHLSL